MNLYLSSYRLGNRPEILQEMAGPNKHAAVIANAMDYLGEAERDTSARREIDDLAKLGFTPEELDLREYFGDPAGLTKKLGGYGLVWTRGGNAFLLRQAMEKSGFDQALIKRLESDPEFVYAGYSAGIVVLGPTLEGLEIVDDVHARADKYDKSPVWRGIGVVDFSIAPHFESDHPESPAISKVVQYFEQHAMPYKTLHDGEAIVIRGDDEEIAGS